MVLLHHRSDADYVCRVWFEGGEVMIVFTPGDVFALTLLAAFAVAYLTLSAAVKIQEFFARKRGGDKP